MTLDGSVAHLTRMDGISDETPSQPGELCMIPAGLGVHLAWTNHAPVQASLMVEFDPALFPVYAPEVATSAFLRGHLVPANYGTRPVLGKIIHLIGREIDPAQRRGRLFAETAVRLLALEIAGSAWSVPARLPERSGTADPRVSRAIDFIEAFFTRDLSILDIAAAAGLSPTQLGRAFRAATGRTPYAYVVERRLQHAVTLLRTTALPIAVVALEAGFSDQAHLTRAVRQHLGRTPRAIRMG